MAPALCQTCVHFVPKNRSCVAAKVTYSAIRARRDDDMCGPWAELYKPLPGMTGARVNAILEAEMQEWSTPQKK
jgi:hypothetical protein